LPFRVIAVSWKRLLLLLYRIVADQGNKGIGFTIFRSRGPRSSPGRLPGQVKTKNSWLLRVPLP
jgi:hypothetical protein